MSLKLRVNIVPVRHRPAGYKDHTWWWVEKKTWFHNWVRYDGVCCSTEEGCFDWLETIRSDYNKKKN